MPRYSLLNNDERGEVEVFLAADVKCESCHAEAVVRVLDAIKSPSEACPHAIGCRDKSRSELVKLDWYYAFGEEGFNWDADPEGPFPTIGEARDAAQEAVDELPPVTPLQFGAVADLDWPDRTVWTPINFDEALGALAAATARGDRNLERLIHLELAARNAAYKMEGARDATPEGWRRDQIAEAAADLRTACDGIL